MIRKKKVQHLDPRQVRLVENALYYANPPDRPQITHERAPPMLEYIRKLLYKDLTKVNTEKVIPPPHTHTKVYRLFLYWA